MHSLLRVYFTAYIMVFHRMVFYGECRNRELDELDRPLLGTAVDATSATTAYDADVRVQCSIALET
jgi:hypothetical protein